jgi:SAM-dependent methyltransferase
LTAAAASRGATVIAADLSEAMVAIAGARQPGIEFRQADAEHLPFSDRTFDAVVANLLLPHLPRPEAGTAEMVRVLRSGGWLAVSMWDIPARSRLVGVMWEAIAEIGSPPPSKNPPGPPPFRYSDESELQGLLRLAGLEDVGVRRVEFSHPIPSVEHLWKAWTEGSVRTASAVRDQPAHIQDQIRAAFDRRASLYADERGLHVPVSFLIAFARKASSSSAG